MKKLFTLLSFLLIFNLNSKAQCFSTLTVQSNSCDSTCSGLAVWTFTGGQMPYSIYVNGAGPFTASSAFTQANLCPGVYNYVVIDANGDTCSGGNSFVITAMQPPVVQINSVNATCSVCNDGAASIVNVTGGNPPYTYNWNNGSTAPAITNLSPGIYWLYTTDVNGCTAIDTVIIGIGNNGFYTLQGNVYYDTNNNGLKDGGEPGVSNQTVNLAQGAMTGLTNLQGDYFFIIAPGTYDVSFVGAPGWLLSSSPSSYNTSVSVSSVSGLDFGIFPDSTYLNANSSIYSNFPRCFNNVPYYLTIYNSGFTMLTGALTLTNDANLTYVSSSIPPTTSAGNIHSYTFANLSPGQSLTVVVTFTEPAGGISLSSSLAVNATDNFGNQFGTTQTLNQMTSCSCDPNDKSVTPYGIGALNYVANDSWLEYLLRFQNTGNDTAFVVSIIDTIDAGLDMSTLTLLSSSHPVEVNTKPGREVEFRFNNILLPDSIVDEPGSHGFVLYRIKGMPTNPDPTSVHNTAYIYFDLNSAVVTNTTLTTFSDNFLGIADVNIQNSQYSISPNPMSNGAVLRYNGTDSKEIYVEVIDLAGRSVKQPQRMKNGSLFISKDCLNKGTYLVKIKSNTVSYMRLIVQ